jgi:hypothetical protein
MLTEKQKQIVTSIWAAAEQGNALANMRWEQAKVRPGCVECGAPITASDPTATTCHAHAKEQREPFSTAKGYWNGDGMEPMKPTQPPVGDVEARIAALEKECNKRMAEELAIAREGYVNLDDAEKAIRAEVDQYDSNAAIHLYDLPAKITARLAKPAEQQPEHVLEIESRHSDYGQDAGGYAVLRFDGEWIGRCDDREAAAKLIAYVAALKAGKR